MSIWAVLPTKPFDEGKTRLAEILSADQRRKLNREFFERTLRIALQVFPSRRVLVASRSAEAHAIAKGYGATTMMEGEHVDLNATLHAASQQALKFGADGVLSISVDLPLLEPLDLCAMLNVAPGRGVAIAGDQNQIGTNALLIRPPGLIEYKYGEDSFAAHVGAARLASVRPETVCRPGLAFDVDTPVDWRAWRAMAAESSAGISGE